jgi:hypothetical protein
VPNTTLAERSVSPFQLCRATPFSQSWPVLVGDIKRRIAVGSSPRPDSLAGSARSGCPGTATVLVAPVV